MEDWYRVKKLNVISMGGKFLINQYYNGSLLQGMIASIRVV